MSRSDVNNVIGQEDYLNKRIFGRNFLVKFFRSLFDYRILQQLEALIIKAQKLGLPKTYIENALIEIEYNEFELSFELVVEQMYEYDLKIDDEFYELAMAICDTLKIDKQKYHFLNELKESIKK